MVWSVPWESIPERSLPLLAALATVEAAWVAVCTIWQLKKHVATTTRTIRLNRGDRMLIDF